MIILFFLVVLLALFLGFPVALTLGGVSILMGLCFLESTFLELLPLRVWGIMTNPLLLSVPLFVFMGLILQKSGIAEALLNSASVLLGKRKAGLALAVVIVGGILAATTGIVGATVVTMGLISLPAMLKQGYKPQLALGTIAASGTLGQIIPPSVVLVLLGSVLNVSVGDLFIGALFPGLLLISFYLLYIGVLATFFPQFVRVQESTITENLSLTNQQNPAIQSEVEKTKVFDNTLSHDELHKRSDQLPQADPTIYNKISRLMIALLPATLLIVAVLGTLFAGIASPTEAAGVGAAGALLIALMQKKISRKDFYEVLRQTTWITSMVFTILVGASAFSLVFRGLGGDVQIIDFLNHTQLSREHFIWLVMGVVFIAGFFIDFIEIIFIIVPILLPLLGHLNIDPLWFGILIALNLQTSFLTPPFGFALFYLKGVAPPTITTSQIYRGVLPFIGMQFTILILIYFFPSLVRVNWF